MTEPRKAIVREQITRLKENYDLLLKDQSRIFEGNKIYSFRPDGQRGKYPWQQLRQNPLQRELLEAWENPVYRIFVYHGSNKLGKTVVASVLAHSTIMGHFPWDNSIRLYFPHNQPRKIRIVGQDWEKHIKTVLVPALKEWWPKDRKLKGGKPKKNSLGVEAFWEDNKTGSTIELMSNKQETALFEGWDGDLVIYDEPPRRDIRVACLRGLVVRKGRELITATLLGEAWIHTDIVNARDEKGRPDNSVFSISGTMYDVVGYGPVTLESIKHFEKNLTEEEKQARIYGKPFYLAGLVCKNYKRKIHLKKRFKIPLDWIVDIAIDIHPRKEQAVLFIATSPQQIKYIFHEIWQHGDGKQVGEWITRFVRRYSLRIGQVIIDPLAKGDRNNDNTTYDKIEAVLYRHDMMLETATKDKKSGIIEINSHLLGPNNEPSIFVFDDMVRTVYEFESWMYDKDTQKPAKVNDDMMENLYRLLLLDTVYYPPDEVPDEDQPPSAQDNLGCTGY